MREFGKTPRPPFWKRILLFFSTFFFNSELNSTSRHHDRIEKRRRKTRFDK